MDNFTEILRELHTNLLRIRSISEEIQSGPRRLHRLQARIAAAVKAVTDHQAALKANKVAIHEREISVKANVEKINKHKRDLNTATAKKEFDALNVEIAVLEKRNRDLEDQILDLMGQADDLAAKTPALEAAAAKANEEFDQAEAEYKSQVAGTAPRRRASCFPRIG
jgi:predicted  nucleic acid-binding Zn-ribbon protein